MALVKVCDACGTGLGGDMEFVQTRGSVSDQYEPGGGVVQFRYLTSGKDETHTFCDDACEMNWRASQRARKTFVGRMDDGEIHVSV